MKEKIEEFFYHLLAYGGISVDEGVLYIWNDPAIFVPEMAVIELHNFLIEKLGQDAVDLLYFAQYLNGKNAVKLLKNRYGIKTKDINKFASSGILDGWGKIKIDSVNEKKFEFFCSSKNNLVSLAYQKNNIKTDRNMDFCYAGLIAGGGSSIYNKPLFCEEISCIAKGDDICKYKITACKEEYIPQVIKSFKNYKKIIENSYIVYAKRKSHFNILKKTNIKIGDGYFIHEGIKGVIIESYIFLIIDRYLKKLLKKEYDIYLKEISIKFIDSIFSKIPVKSMVTASVVEKSLELLAVFGMGKMNLVPFSKHKFYIHNLNGPLSRDYPYIFSDKGHKKNIDDFIASILQELLSRLYKKNVKVIETQCRAYNLNRCVFEVNL